MGAQPAAAEQNLFPFSELRPELLGLVLLHLPAVEAVRCARVARGWAAAARSLPALRLSFSIAVPVHGDVRAELGHVIAASAQLFSCLESPYAAQISHLEVLFAWRRVYRRNEMKWGPAAGSALASSRPFPRLSALQQLDLDFVGCSDDPQWHIRTHANSQMLIRALLRNRPLLRCVHLSEAGDCVIPTRGTSVATYDLAAQALAANVGNSRGLSTPVVEVLAAELTLDVLSIRAGGHLYAALSCQRIRGCVNTLVLEAAGDLVVIGNTSALRTTLRAAHTPEQLQQRCPRILTLTI